MPCGSKSGAIEIGGDFHAIQIDRIRHHDYFPGGEGIFLFQLIRHSREGTTICFTQQRSTAPALRASSGPADAAVSEGLWIPIRSR